jgi:hypothetical protein
MHLLEQMGDKSPIGLIALNRFGRDGYKQRQSLIGSARLSNGSGSAD